MLIRQRFNMLLFRVMLSCIAFSPASSREWKTTPDASARDYATIRDRRDNGDLVLIAWFVSQMVTPGSPGAPVLIPMLEKYVVIIVAHGNRNQTSGAMSFDNINTLEVRDRSEKPLTLLARDTLPPTTIGMLVSLETLFRQTFGAMGNGMKMFVFDAGAVHSCEKGGMSVPFAGETYTWETPIPGCPQK